MILADAVTSVRTLIDDNPKPVFKENLSRSPIPFGNQVGGGNKNFKLNNRRIVASTLTTSQDGAAYAAPASEDDTRGTFILASAPASSLFAQYDWHFLTDTEIESFITNALSFIGVATTDSVPQGLVDTLIKQASGDAALSLSSRAATLYNAAAGGKTLSKDSIKKQYSELADKYHKAAESERENFYKEKGAREKPSFGRATTSQNPYTPRR